ncbi:UNKNOWN [Stylonychia lemnae]|uniref:Transmembrane protein n=1 Tax=Stylonychia lemnae TaxID=5949 RepID=A0A078B661_STYLE|nr:UNKNOWN [Stylonychia lemnae]|eukprot:CDW89013.1 UNKNOWN [Stylonychia lemnae]
MNCSNMIDSVYMKYSVCNFDIQKCGYNTNIIKAEKKMLSIKSNDSKSFGNVCSYKISQADGEITVIRIVNATNVKVQASVGGDSFTSEVSQSEDIVRIGSLKYQLQQDEYLYLNLIMLNGTYELNIYTIGHEQYMDKMKMMLIIFYCSTFGILLFLFMTQKCRIVQEIHNREIEEYRQRKNLYKEFETEEIFSRNQAAYEQRRLREQDELMKDLRDLSKGNQKKFDQYETKDNLFTSISPEKQVYQPKLETSTLSNLNENNLPRNHALFDNLVSLNNDLQGLNYLGPSFNQYNNQQKQRSQIVDDNLNRQSQSEWNNIKIYNNNIVSPIQRTNYDLQGGPSFSQSLRDNQLADANIIKPIGNRINDTLSMRVDDYEQNIPIYRKRLDRNQRQ